MAMILETLQDEETGNYLFTPEEAKEWAKKSISQIGEEIARRMITK